MKKEYLKDGNFRIRKENWDAFTIVELKEALDLLGTEYSNYTIWFADEADFPCSIYYNARNDSLTFE